MKPECAVQLSSGPQAFIHGVNDVVNVIKDLLSKLSESFWGDVTILEDKSC